jgi:hypothetical protein
MGLEMLTPLEAVFGPATKAELTVTVVHLRYERCAEYRPSDADV